MVEKFKDTPSRTSVSYPSERRSVFSSAQLMEVKTDEKLPEIVVGSSTANETAGSSPPSDASPRLLCFSLERLSTAQVFVASTVCVFVFYLIYGYFLELIFRLEGFRRFGWYLTLVQFAYYCVFGLCERKLKQLSGTQCHRQIPLKLYGMLAFLTVATMGLSNSAVGYLNYPTQVIFKCCKLIPVLIGGFLIQGKKYGMLDVSACVLMSGGLVLFTLADTEVSPSFNSYGILLISLALCADAMIGNFQEKYMKKYTESNSEMILYSYSIGFVYILVALATSGQLPEAFNFCMQWPWQTYGYAFLLSVSGYLGLSVVLVQVKTFGALTAVTVTTCRKAVTIILSFLLFSKPFTIKYLLSGLVVVAGIYLNLYSKNKKDLNFVDVYRKCVSHLRPEMTSRPPTASPV